MGLAVERTCISKRHIRRSGWGYNGLVGFSYRLRDFIVFAWRRSLHIQMHSRALKDHVFASMACEH